MMRRFLKNQRGQSAIVVVLTGAVMMALAATSLDLGHVYYAYQQLVASTNAAALAGAQAMPNTTQATTNVATYSAQTGDLNANPMLQSVVATPTFLCLNTVSGTLNVECQTVSGATGGYNALSVTQTATIPLWFGGLIGMHQMNVTAVSTAAMRGGQNVPWNIAIVLDTTNSMSNTDKSGQCNGTQISCALLGVQALLNDLYPCALGETCTSSTAYVDSVSLYVFPAVTTVTAPNDYTCPSSGSQQDPTIVAYTFPDTSPAYTTGQAPPSNLLLPSGDEYQVIGYSNNYKTSDTATSLNQAADIVIAAGDSGKSKCPGIQAPGGEKTFYAQAIYQAQADLATQQTNNPGSKNAMIILSDGNATACATNANTSAGACDDNANLVATEGTLNGTGTSSTNATGYESPIYPSALGECGQAVLAAQFAANSGTTVYTIGYGAETSGGCLSDAHYSSSVTTNGGNWSKGDQPCQALAAMASAEVNFYSDDETGSGLGCQATAPSNQNIKKLTAIFTAITDNLSEPRLIPNGTT
jgi:Flp pilus assembly protein TadG